MIKKEKLIGNLATQLPPRARLKKKNCVALALSRKDLTANIYSRDNKYL